MCNINNEYKRDCAFSNIFINFRGTKIKKMDILKEIQSEVDFFVELRHQIHQHPEIGFEEKETSKLVADLLTKWGYEVTTGIGETGVVGTLHSGTSTKVIGIRADMDALPMVETSGKKWTSKVENRFHGCGHDGHTTTLLCAAKYLAEHRSSFDGTIHLIFQPAEEALTGGRKMLEDELFEKFPCDIIFALHNFPGVPFGHFVFKCGEVMASSDTIHIEVIGKGAHGAMPENGIDATLIACYIATALQTVVSRNISPLQAGVITIGSIQAGNAPNIVNERALMKLTVRALDSEIRKTLVKRISEIAHLQAESFGAKVNIEHVNSGPVLINGKEATCMAQQVAEDLFGKDKAYFSDQTTMGSEDFATMLEANPNGCYFMVGAGNDASVCSLHNPGYDFNDDLIGLGATFWVKLAQSYLK